MTTKSQAGQNWRLYLFPQLCQKPQHRHPNRFFLGTPAPRISHQEQHFISIARKAGECLWNCLFFPFWSVAAFISTLTIPAREEPQGSWFCFLPTSYSWPSHQRSLCNKNSVMTDPDVAAGSHGPQQHQVTSDFSEAATRLCASRPHPSNRCRQRCAMCVI